MRANKSKFGSRGRTRRVGLRPGAAAILLVAAWWTAGPVIGAGAAETLRWKFQAGETLRFSIETKSSMTAKVMGTDRKSNQTQTVETSWKVKSVDASGQAEITLRMDRIRLKVEMPPLMPLDFDSNTTKGDQPGFEGITRHLNAQVGAEFTFKMKPNGEITDIKLSDETLKRLREAAPPGAPEGEVSENAIKDTLLQSSPPSFPDGPIEPGKSWSPKPTRLPLPTANLVMEKTFTYQGPDPKSPNLMLVNIDTSAKIEPVDGVDIKLTVKKQGGKGTLVFDGQAGRVKSVRLTQTIDMSSVQAGQTMDQSTETNTAMSLLSP
jgi:Family of unknown function (DUF6263)